MNAKQDGFYVVKCCGRWFDVAVISGKPRLASAHDGGDVPWGVLGVFDGEWTNASPFPTPRTSATNEPPKQIKPNGAVKVGGRDDDMQAKVDEALSLVSQINDLAEDMPERGEEYASSVVEKANIIGETIEEKGFVTDKQLNALENMISGMQRWIDR